MVQDPVRPQVSNARRYAMPRGRTWTYSTTLLSPRSRVAETLVAGKALGTTVRTVRRLELMTDSEEIVTIAQRISNSLQNKLGNTDIESGL